ncbi:MAG: hypothetical protein Q9221_005934 [Calogaya cf. arnoldii]
MEAIAVLGLVANIVQLVDAAGKAFTICREIYISGETIEDKRMAFTSKQLLDACNDLNKSFNPNNSPATPTRSGNNLNLLATKCSQTAQDLQAELDSLRTSPGSGVRSTLQKAWLKKIKSKKIDKIKLALDELEKTLNSVVLIDVRQALDALNTKQEGQSKILEQQLTRVSSNLQSCQSNLATSLRSDIDKHNQASEAQHMLTRENVNTHTTRAMQDLSLSQKAQLDEQKQQQHLQQQHDQILNSLRFNEINTRMNDIAESHAETFHWIFKEDATGPWDSFSEWLKADSHVYWINGKAGSGKSTLMRFLVGDPRTREILAQWSLDQPPLIMEFYFWLSGTEMQRSLKGLLCSILHQLFHENDSLVKKLLHNNPSLLSKRNPGDWSKKELRSILMRSVDLLHRPLCVFLDGLDEYKQDDDIDQLLNLIDDISASRTTKFCVSSRPEHYLAKRMSAYKQLRLQDLTANDMDIYIRTALEGTRNRCRPGSVEDEHLEYVVGNIAEKADGVFLWVHYALSSLVTGMRKEDTFKDLLRRIEQLPSGMHQLYLQMWNRLNEDKQQYQVDAATYFSYAAVMYESGPSSLFELLVALDPQLQKTIVDDLTPQDPLTLSQDCEVLKTRVLTRTAGLLDFSVQELDFKTGELNNSVVDFPANEEEDSILSQSTESSGSTERVEATADLICSSSSGIHKSWRDPTIDSGITSVAGIQSQNGDSPGGGSSHGHSTLMPYYMSNLKYLHRSARDFLLDTEDGQKLCGSPQDPPATSLPDIISGPPIRVLLLRQGYNDPVCPSEEDSLYLGEALDAILFQDDILAASKQALADDFDARVNEVSERSPNKDPQEWVQQYTAMLKEEGRLADASGMSPEALGEDWFV